MSSSELAELESEFKKFREQIQEPMLDFCFEIYWLEFKYLRPGAGTVAPSFRTAYDTRRVASRDAFASYVALASFSTYQPPENVGKLRNVENDQRSFGKTNIERPDTLPPYSLCRDIDIVEDLRLDRKKLYTDLRRFAGTHRVGRITYIDIYEAIQESFEFCLKNEKDDEILESIGLVLHTSLKKIDEGIYNLREALKHLLRATANDHSPKTAKTTRSYEDLIKSCINDLGICKTEGSIDPSRYPLGTLGRVVDIIRDMEDLCAKQREKQIEENKATGAKGEPT